MRIIQNNENNNNNDQILPTTSFVIFALHKINISRYITYVI